MTAAKIHLIFIFLAVAPHLPVSTTAQTATFDRYEQNRRAMGVRFQLVAYAEDSAAVQTAFDAAFKRIDEIEKTLSNYLDDSEVSRLESAKANEQYRVSKDLWKVLCLSQQYSQLTDGAFDVTLGRLTELWRAGRKRGRLPNFDALASAKRNIGYDKLKLLPDQQAVQFAVPAIKLDFGGIGKGYAADAALEALRRHGMASALVDAGGDLAIGDPPPGRSGWRIMIELAPSSSFVELHNCGVATSGHSQQFIEVGGKRYSHILDPKTGYGLQDNKQVTVIGSDATQSDAMASAMTVIEFEKAIDLADRMEGLEVMIIQPTAARRVVQSRGFPELSTTHK